MNEDPFLSERKNDEPSRAPQQGLYQEGACQRQGEYKEGAYQGGSRQDAFGQGAYRQDANNANRYGQYSGQQMGQEPYQPVSQGFGVASLVMGVLSLVLFCSCVNIILAIIAIVFGVVQLTRAGSKKGMAIAGIVTSALSILLFLAFSVMVATSADFQKGFREGFERELERRLGDEFYDEFEDTFRFSDDEDGQRTF